MLYGRSWKEGYPLGQVSAWWQTAVPKGRLRSALPENPRQGMWQLSYLACLTAGTSRRCSAAPLDQSQAVWAYLQHASALILSLMEMASLRLQQLRKRATAQHMGALGNIQAIGTCLCTDCTASTGLLHAGWQRT